jgi:exosortase A-associated hydrolase 1
LSAIEKPIVFECEGSELIGLVHLPERMQTRRGLLIVVPGGPQYRAGVARLQVQIARELASRGVPVMRFDYRGLGDSEGPFRGFEDVGSDLGAAVRAFREHAPGVEDVVLWGGCDAASAVMMNAWRYPEVSGMALGNPWVHTETTGDRAEVSHFGRRFRERDFWIKVLRGQYNPWPALQTIGRRLRASLAAPGRSNDDADDASPDFVLRMRNGLTRFKGDLLLVISGRSPVSREFDVLVETEPLWRQAMRSPRCIARRELPESDQTFSSVETRARICTDLADWILEREASA